MVTLSVLITYYEELTLLDRCLKSIENQTVQPDEVIIYDDASVKPLTPESLSSYRFPIIVINGKNNEGPAHGRNVLMRMCKSEYFRFQDADDELFETAIERIKKKIEGDGKPDLVFNEISSYNENGTLRAKSVIGLVKLMGNLIDFSISHVLLIPSVTYKSSFALSVGGFKSRHDLPQSEDSDYIRRVCLKAKSFSVIHNSLAKQNLRSNSHSHTNPRDVWCSGYKSLLSFKKDLVGLQLVTYSEKMLFYGIQLLAQKDNENAKKAFLEVEHNHIKKSTMYHPIKRKLSKWVGFYRIELLALHLRKFKHD